MFGYSLAVESRVSGSFGGSISGAQIRPFGSLGEEVKPHVRVVFCQLLGGNENRVVCRDSLSCPDEPGLSHVLGGEIAEWRITPTRAG